MTRVLVVGFGNQLMGDDGAGPAAVAEIRRRSASLGPHRIEDGGTDVLNLPALWRGEAEVWILDAVHGRLQAGEIHRLGHSDLLALRQRTASCHQLSVPECLLWLRHSWPDMAQVRYRMWGIQPDRIEATGALSPAVSRSVQRVADEVLAELAERAERCD